MRHLCEWDTRNGERQAIEFESRGIPYDLDVIHETMRDGYFVRYDHQIAGGTVVDIGANIGCVAMTALVHDPQRIVMIEPNWENFELLRRNVEGVKAQLGVSTVLDFHQAAVGDPNTAKWVRSDGDASRATTIYDESGGTIPVYGWSDVIDQYITFLKVDCEGGEYDFFETAPDVSRVRRIHLEWHHVTPPRVGALVEKLLRTHKVELFGRPEDGGMLAANRY